MKTTIVALGLACAISLIVGCSRSSARENSPVVVGVIAPLTGSKAEQGIQFKEAAELAASEINNHGGVLGHRVELEILDDEGKPNVAASAAQQLAADDSVVAVIGPSSTASAS